MNGVLTDRKYNMIPVLAITRDAHHKSKCPGKYFHVLLYTNIVCREADGVDGVRHHFHVRRFLWYRRRTLTTHLPGGSRRVCVMIATFVCSFGITSVP